MKRQRDASSRRLPSPYDRFVEAEGIPLHRGVAFNRVQDLELGEWKRMGGRGAYLQPNGTEDAWGMYLVQIRPGGALAVERHLYQETLYALQGSGVTESWEGEGDRVSAFEWEAGSLFSIPLNSFHRICNASLLEPALLLAGTSAPGVVNLFADPAFVFDCPYGFGLRAKAQQTGRKGDGEPERLDPPLPIMPRLVDVRLPDPVGSHGPRRTLELDLSEGFGQILIEQGVGSYPAAATFPAGTVLICLSGEGYSYGWPAATGKRPWQQGEGDRVRRHDYQTGSVVSAAPLADDWFHQDFAVGHGPLRLLAWLGPPKWPAPVAPGARERVGRKDVGGRSRLPLAGATIPHRQEDPRVRENYLEQLGRRGGRFEMDAQEFGVGGNGEEGAAGAGAA
jgi:hypothetical protein